LLFGAGIKTAIGLPSPKINSSPEQQIKLDILSGTFPGFESKKYEKYIEIDNLFGVITLTTLQRR
jgi:hypothetical protein